MATTKFCARDTIKRRIIEFLFQLFKSFINPYFYDPGNWMTNNNNGLGIVRTPPVYLKLPDFRYFPSIFSIIFMNFLDLQDLQRMMVYDECIISYNTFL